MQRKCLICERVFDAGDSPKYCSPICEEIANNLGMGRTNKNSRSHSMSRLTEKTILAREMGMTYGQYQMKRFCGGMFG